MEMETSSENSVILKEGCQRSVTPKKGLLIEGQKMQIG